MLKAAATLDIKNMVPFISKNFKLQTFPKVADLPDEPMVTTLERYGVVFSSMEKLEVCIQLRTTAFGLTG